MILNRTLDAAERLASQKTLRNYWAAFALGQACCGEATIQLMALAINIPDRVVAAMGAMNYAGFLALPLGFVLGGKQGAGKSMQLENYLAALAALLLATSPWTHPILFWGALLLFLVARAANNAMRFPLQSHIAIPSEVPSMLSRNYVSFWGCTLLGCLAVSLTMQIFPGNGTLAAVFAAGSIFFICSGGFINRVKEPQEVKKLAEQKLSSQLKAAWQNPLVRHQIYAGCMINLFLAAVVPMNILCAKRGMDASDALIILLAAIQAMASVAGSVMVKHITNRCGPRKMMLIGYPLVWLIPLFWLLIPADAPRFVLVLPFIMGGMVLMALGTSLENYFLVTVPEKLQIGGTFLVFVVTGGCSGAAGMALNWLLFYLAENFCDSSSAMAPFRFYYAIVGALFALGILAPWSLPGKAEEYRNMIRSKFE